MNEYTEHTDKQVPPEAEYGLQSATEQMFGYYVAKRDAGCSKEYLLTYLPTQFYTEAINMGTATPSIWLTVCTASLFYISKQDGFSRVQLADELTVLMGGAGIKDSVQVVLTNIFVLICRHLESLYAKSKQG